MLQNYRVLAIDGQGNPSEHYVKAQDKTEAKSTVIRNASVHVFVTSVSACKPPRRPILPF